MTFFPQCSFHFVQISLQKQSSKAGSKPFNIGNSIAPFHTIMKPTCGYFFNREGDNRRKKLGIPAADLVAWRSVRSPYSRTLVAG